MEQNISIQDYYKLVLHSYQLKNTSNILVLLERIKNITKLDILLAPTFVNHYITRCKS